MFFSPSRLGFFLDPFGEDSVEVSNDVYHDAMDKLGKGYTLSADNSGQPVLNAPVVSEPTLDVLFPQLVRTLNANYETAAAQLRGTYPFTETSTWPQQIDQAKAYDAWRKAGRDSATRPDVEFIEDLSNQRTAVGVGEGLDDLVDRILANNAMYSPAISELTATRHAAEQALTIAFMQKDLAALKAVKWDFTLG